MTTKGSTSSQAEKAGLSAPGTKLAANSTVELSMRGNVVSINVPREALFDVKSLNRIQDVVLGKLGCPTCHSGFDFRWRMRDRFQF